MKFIHISDIYLGAEPDKGKEWSEQRAKELYETFDRVIQLCIDEKINLLMIAGNLFNSQPTVEDLEKLDETLLRLEGTRTVILGGFRDYISPGCAMETYKFRSKTVVLPGGRTANAYLKGINTCVTGYSYDRPVVENDVISEISPGREDAVNILLACGGDSQHMPFDRKKLARKGFAYAALGGNRKPVHILKDRMAYCGSPEPLSPADTGKHGIIIGEVKDGKTTINWMPFSKRNYVTFNIDVSYNISGEQLSDAIVDRVRKLGFDNIYTISYTGLVDSKLSIDLKRIKDRYNIYDIIDNTVPMSDLENMEAEHTGDLAGAFCRATRELPDISNELKEKMTMYGLEAMARTGER
ncbi:MAG TPA: DNA repair exonuclease [Lachnospiraceae bacterium]|nr:DNA repair exonuclease [Lachnospiraceae bacterium]